MILFLLLCAFISKSYEWEESADCEYGAVFRLTKKGLTYAANKAFPSMWEDNKWNLSKYYIKHVNETVDDVNYFIEILHLKQSMDEDNFKASVDIDSTSQCLKITINDSLAALQGNVTCRDVNNRDLVQNCNITMYIPWYFKVHIGKDRDGDLTSEMCNASGDSCSIPITNMTINYTGCNNSNEGLCEKGTEDFKDIFIKNKLNKTLHLLDVCHNLGHVIDTISKKLKRTDLFPTIQPGSLFNVDLSMPKNPTYNKTFIDTYHKGDVFWHSTMEKYHTEFVNFTRDKNTTKMFYLWISKDGMTSFFEGFQRHGILHYMITAENLHAGHGLNTTCDVGVCVGRLVPSLAKTYPRCFMDLDFYSLETPTLTFDKNLAVLSGKMVMFVSIRDPEKKLKGSPITIAKLDGKVTLRIKVSMSDTQIQGEVVAFNPYIDTINVDPAITGFDRQTVNFILLGAVVVTLEPKLNELGKKGFYIPISHAKLQNTTIQLIEEAIVIGSDLEYCGNNCSSFSYF